jgi:release factor glutamine methyltransferase
MRAWKIVELIASAAEYLQKRQLPSPRLDAELLLAHVLNLSRLNLYVNFNQIVEPQKVDLYRELVKKRSNRIPVNYLINCREFMSLELYVDQRVLIPRPETEVLVETIFKLDSNNSNNLNSASQEVLEIGTGSGAIAVSLAVKKPSWKIVATDISYQALYVAQRNAQKHQLLECIAFICANLFEPIKVKDGCGSFDWILSNPPYIPSSEIPKLAPEIKDYEPKVAVDGGEDGLDIIRSLIFQAPKFLKPKGKLAFEIGVGQADKVKKLVDDSGRYANRFVVKDYSGVDRVVVAETE